MKSIIAKSTWFVDSDLRLDASYHLSDTNRIKHIFSTLPYLFTTIQKQSEKIFSGNIFKRTYVKDPERGIPYITGSDMIKLDITSGKYLSKKQATGLKKLLLEKGWILVTCSGTLGNTVYTNDLFAKSIATHDLIRIIPNNKNIKEGFLYAYLSSKYGYTLLTQSSYGGVVKHIEPHHLSNIPIPIFPTEKQQQIHDLITESAELRVEANKMLGDAVELFENEIGKSKVTMSSQNDIVSISKIQNFLSRIDAQYQIITQKLDNERDTTLEYRKISTLSKRIYVGNRAKRNYVENGIPFLSSSDMILFNPKRYAKQISQRTPSLNNLLVSRNDILISRSGTVGNVVIVGDDLKNSAVSEHALRLEIDDSKIAPEYVFCYLNTKQGKIYMEASAFGSVIITLNEDLIGNIDVPILTKNHSDFIVSKIKIYIEKLDLATLKESQAIQLVENEIEQWQN